MKIYLAGPIFFLGDKLRNDYFYNRLKEAFPDADIYDPLQNTDINGVEGKKKPAGPEKIVDADMARLSNTDVLIACIDSDVLPAGTSCEIGIMYNKILNGEKRYMIGICTDTRQCALTHSEEKDLAASQRLGAEEYSYQNIFVTGCLWKCGGLVYSIDEVIDYINEIKDNIDCIGGECHNDL